MGGGQGNGERVATAHVVVDGLDEMAPGAVTIAGLLPAELGPYVHVVVTSRPDPEPLAQVVAEHPLRRAQVARLHSLDVADVATLLVAHGRPADLAGVLADRVVTVTGGEPLLTRFVVEDVVAGNKGVLDGLERDPPTGVKDYFARQFRQLETRAVGNMAWEVLGVLLVARAPLSAEELAGVLAMPLREISRAIEPVRRFLLGRDRLELMHVELRAVVAEQFSPAERQAHRRRLLAWCRRMSEGDPPGASLTMC